VIDAERGGDVGEVAVVVSPDLVLLAPVVREDHVVVAVASMSHATTPKTCRHCVPAAGCRRRWEADPAETSVKVPSPLPR